MQNIKAIFFDAGGTLFRPYPSVGYLYAETAAQHGIHADAEELERRFQQAWRARNGLATLQGQTNEKIERDWWYDLVKEIFSHVSPSPPAAFPLRDLRDQKEDVRPVGLPP